MKYFPVLHGALRNPPSSLEEGADALYLLSLLSIHRKPQILFITDLASVCPSQRTVCVCALTWRCAKRGGTSSLATEMGRRPGANTLHVSYKGFHFEQWFHRVTLNSALHFNTGTCTSKTVSTSRDGLNPCCVVRTVSVCLWRFPYLTVELQESGGTTVTLIMGEKIGLVKLMTCLHRSPPVPIHGITKCPNLCSVQYEGDRGRRAAPSGGRSRAHTEQHRPCRTEGGHESSLMLGPSSGPCI